MLDAEDWKKNDLCLQRACYPVEKAGTSEWALPQCGQHHSIWGRQAGFLWASSLRCTGRLLLPSTGWSSSVQSGLALEPTPDNSSGPSKVRLWKTLHLPPWSLGALSSHVWSSTAVTLLCCELAKWGGCRKVRDAWPARSCSSYASTGARHVISLGENNPAEPSQPTETC